ncbi:amino-acid N-acetyltransferase [Arsenicicoccus dermatophilus]|uniref:amino-acid N-acetyltransferase n=1 Tax=Arsenicicoccus dermatophilus TaxID=1076331 RepID=UPI001F4CDC08|nr:amino-acid N-acetyltransferase [Arsenicicoccus dermatophilus]MCH8613898.1 amino-acid N-acetyltransferase [Arsenicicoccus dermatophilus]
MRHTPQQTPVTIRRARTADVLAIRGLVQPYAEQRILLAKDTVAYFEAVQQFRVAEVDGVVVGCGALHVFWEDVAEVRTLAVAPEAAGHGVGGRLVQALLGDARELGVARVFCLTFEVDFFARYGFHPIEGAPVAPEVFAELVRSYDEGTAEFLDLDRVKPNTLGNTRMLVTLQG